VKVLAVCAIAAFVLGACAGGPPHSAAPTAPDPAATAPSTLAPATQAAGTTEPTGIAGRESNEQTFGPEYPAQPPAGRPVWISKAELSPDRHTLTIEFVGGQPYLASDPCSEDYEPWVAPRGDLLDVEVVNVDRPDQAQLGPNMGCAGVGYSHTYHLRLAAPFLGTAVNDLAQGGTLYVGTPAGALVATALPTGWSLRRAFQQEPGPPPIWVEIYAPGPVGNEWEGPGQFVLYQAFGIVGEWSDTRTIKAQDRGAHAVPVTLNGRPATVWFDEASGELLLAWTLDGQSVGLVGNAADLTPEELIKIAEGVARANQ
jgi:hypothetical protein